MEHFTEDSTRSQYVRDSQYDQLSSYLSDRLRRLHDQRNEYFKPDYENLAAYKKSVVKYRRELKRLIGYPPPHDVAPVSVREERLGEDDLCVVYRLFITVCKEMECCGLYMEPKRREGKLPLILSLHGGAGCPEMICSLVDTTNYHDASRRYLEDGYAVFAPLFSFWPYVDRDSTKIPKDMRSILDIRARWMGTSLAAIEAFKVIRALDWLAKRESIDAGDIGVSGLSYGGFYALLIAALDLRIDYCISSCYFNDRVIVNAAHPGELFDLTWNGIVGKMADAELVAMICPRPCVVEMAKGDYYVPVEGAGMEYPRAVKHYERLGIADRFLYTEFEGTHEFNLEAPMEFLKRRRNGTRQVGRERSGAVESPDGDR